MNKLILRTTLIFCTGCTTVTVDLQEAVYSPKKGGIVRVTNSPIDTPEVKDKSSGIMRSFCAPNPPKILKISKGDKVTGSTSVNHGYGIITTDTESTQHRDIYFECQSPEGDLKINKGS